MSQIGLNLRQALVPATPLTCLINIGLPRLIKKSFRTWNHSSFFTAQSLVRSGQDRNSRSFKLLQLSLVWSEKTLVLIASAQAHIDRAEDQEGPAENSISEKFDRHSRTGGE